MNGLGCANCSAGLVGPGGAANGIPPEMDVITLDRVDIASRAGLGQEVTVRMNGLALRDRPGRYPMVAALIVTGVWEGDTTAAAMPAPYRGYDLLSVLQQWRLKDIAGWSYVDGIDGRTLQDDRQIALGALAPFLDAQDVPDADAANVQRPLTFILRCAHRWDGRGMPIGVDGMIPLGALVGRSDAFQFTVAGASGLAGGNAGIVPSGTNGSWFSATALQPFLHVRAMIVWVDHPHVSAPWQVENYTDANLNGQLRHCERLTEYGVILHFPEDTVGADDIDDYAQIQNEVGGVVRKGGITAAESMEGDRFQYWANPDLEGAIFVPKAGGTLRTTFLSPVQKNLKGDAHGGVTYAFTRATHTFTRFVHRTVAELTDLHERSILAAMGAPAGLRAYSAANNPGKTLPSERMKQFIARRYLAG